MRYTNKQIHIITTASTILGLLVSVATNYYVLNSWNVPISWGQSVSITGIFLAISYVRTFAVQTFFNWLWK